MNNLRKMFHIRLLTAFFLAALVLPLSAQEKADSAFTFRFYSGKNMFYSPNLNNGDELSRMFKCVDQHKDLILNHEMILHVDGNYVATGKNASTRAIAKIRSNRVKSELITRKGLTEDCFLTQNHVGPGNFVVVTLMPVDRTPLSLNVDQAATETPVADSIVAVDPKPTEEIDVPQESVVAAPADSTEINGSQMQSEPLTLEKSDSRFALKTNLLDYAILMPNIEGEWKFADRWSAALEFQTAWYALKKSPRKIYRVGTIIPEIRYWVINRSRWNGMYVGAFAGIGKYDFDGFFGKKGHEGEGAMAGLSVGYMWPISKHLSLDAAVGVGYMRIRDKEYLPAGGHYLYQLTKNIDYVGPLRLKLSLVWRIPTK